MSCDLRSAENTAVRLKPECGRHAVLSHRVSVIELFETVSRNKTVAVDHQVYIRLAATKLHVNIHVSMMLNFKLDEKTNVMRQRVGLSSYREQRRAHVRLHVLIVQRHDLHQVL